MNWFRKDADGRFLWPGFGDNSRVLKWVLDRIAGEGEGVDTPIGVVPAPGAIDVTGLAITDEQMAQLLAVDVEDWRNEAELIHHHYDALGERLPAEMRAQLAALERRLAA